MNMNKIFEGLASMAASRNYMSSAVGASTILVILGSIDSEQAKSLVDALQQFMDGLGTMLGGAKKMYVILGPVGLAILAKFAGNSATLKSRVASVVADPSVKIEGQIVVPPEVAAAVPSAQVVAKAAALLAAVFVGSLFLSIGADAQGLKGIAQRNDVNKIGAASPSAPAADSFDLGGFKITDVIIGKILPDLRYAAALSKQNNNKVTQPCLAAVLKLVDSWNAPVLDDTGQTLSLPEPHLITFLEKQSQLLRQLQPDSDISLGCSSMAQALRKDVMSLVGAIMSGGALGIFKLPVLPIP